MMNENVNIAKLIENIGPINNKIRDADGYEKLSLMWDVGEILLKENVEKIHPIAWKIQDVSYITRDLLSYCYRIRRKWPKKSDLYDLFHNLKSYSAFREVLPLIENEKFTLDDEKIKEIISWLNHDDVQTIKSKIKKMKMERIGIRNDRSRRLTEIEEEATIFKKVHKDILELIENENISKLKELLELGEDTLLKLSQMCVSLSNRNYKGPKEIKILSQNDQIKMFVEKILPVSMAKEEVKARFIRLVRPEIIIQLADIFNSLKSKEPISIIKKRISYRFR